MRFSGMGAAQGARRNAAAKGARFTEPSADVTALPRGDAGAAGAELAAGRGAGAGAGGGAGTGAGAPAVLECRQASFSYGSPSKGPVVREVSFAIRPGEFVALIGSNGAGKTTLSKLLNGLLKPTCGTVLVRGIPTLELRTSELARHVGMLFQNPDRQICQNSVADELAFGPRMAGIAEDEVRRRVDGLVGEFGFDGEAAPYMLSRGERQMLALASVLALEPDVLILDEPTCGLDYRECMGVMARVEELNRRGTTVVMITHDMEVVFDFARRIIAMADGRVVADGAPERIFRNQEAMEAASLLPPQMIELSLRLAQEPENGRAFAHVATAYEMVQMLSAAGFCTRKGH